MRKRHRLDRGGKGESKSNIVQKRPGESGTFFSSSWFKIGKGVRQGCILSPCLFNLYAEYIMRNTGLEEAQAGIKIADDTTLMAEPEEELKSLLMKVKRE